MDREINQIIKIKPTVLHKTESKTIEFNYSKWETKGVKAKILRLYTVYTQDIKAYTIMGIGLYKDTVYVSYELHYDNKERKHFKIGEYSIKDFHQKLKSVIKTLKNSKDANLEKCIKAFGS